MTDGRAVNARDPDPVEEDMRMPPRIPVLRFARTIAAGIVAATFAASLAAATVEGSASFRERMALPPDAVFEAVLLDVSRADAPATTLGRATIAPAVAPPFRFAIAYDDGAMKAGRRYVVRATIKDGAKLLFTTDTAHPVVDGRLAAGEVRMVRVGGPPGARALRGMFTYFADAATFRPCADGAVVPVAMEGEFLALQRAYLDARAEPMQPMLVDVEGRMLSRPSMEAGKPPRRTLVVDRFVGAFPRETCGAPGATSPLRNTYWKLVRLDGKPTAAFAGQREPHLVFDAKAPQVRGNGGCNGAGGDFTVAGDKLTFGPFMSTKMACEHGMEQERRFLEALAEVARYRIRGSHLELLDRDGTAVARFEAVALK